MATRPIQIDAGRDVNDPRKLPRLVRSNGEILVIAERQGGDASKESRGAEEPFGFRREHIPDSDVKPLAGSQQLPVARQCHAIDIFVLNRRQELPRRRIPDLNGFVLAERSQSLAIPRESGSTYARGV